MVAVGHSRDPSGARSRTTAGAWPAARDGAAVRWKSYVAGALVGLLAACAAVPDGPPADVELPAVPPEAHALGPGDVVEIKVFREQDLAGVYRVGPEGHLDFPLIGHVQIRGKKPQEVAEEIRRRLADGYLVDPQVTVFLREMNSQKIHVLGQVNKAGTFPFDVGMSVIQAITNAGGFTKLAATNKVTLTRIDTDGQKKTFRVPVGDIGSGQAANIQLRPGDIIYVPEAIF